MIRAAFLSIMLAGPAAAFCTDEVRDLPLSADLVAASATLDIRDPGSGQISCFGCPGGWLTVDIHLAVDGEGHEAGLRSGSRSIAQEQPGCRHNAPDCEITLLAIGTTRAHSLSGMSQSCHRPLLDGQSATVRATAPGDAAGAGKQAPDTVFTAIAPTLLNCREIN